MNISRIGLAFLFVVILWVSGCTVPMGRSVGALSPVYEGQQLVIYRGDDRGLYFEGMLDGQFMPGGSVKYGSVNVVPVTEGSHTFTLQISTFHAGSTVRANTLSFNVAKGERKFLRVRVLSARGTNFYGSTPGSISHWVMQIEEVDPVTGSKEISGLRYSQ